MTLQHPITGQMQELIQDWQRSGDRREIFLSCYGMMTANMLAAVEAGEFEDCDWVSGLLQRFAEYYFAALADYERDPSAAPRVWQAAFAACRRPRTHVLQNLILGVNAHINYDLVLALRDRLAPEWAKLDPAGRELRYRDHCRVNAIIAETIDAVQDEVIERENAVLDVVDRLMGRLDEWATARLITVWREEVWQEVEQLLNAVAEYSVDAEQQTLLRVERRAMQRARAILGETGPLCLVETL